MTQSPIPGITPTELETVRDILMGVLPAGTKAWAFGSRANGTFRRDSDLDLVVDAGAPLPRSLWHAVMDAFEASTLPYPVDVVDWHRISGDFQKLIQTKRSLLR